MRVLDEKNEVALPLSTRAGCIAAREYAAVLMRIGQRDDEAMARAIEARVCAHMAEWVLVASDGIGMTLHVCSQGTAMLDSEMENGPAYMVEHYLGEVIEPGLWLWVGTISGKTYNTVDGYEYDVEYHGEYVRAERTHLRFIDIDCAEHAVSLAIDQADEEWTPTERLQFTSMVLAASQGLTQEAFDREDGILPPNPKTIDAEPPDDFARFSAGDPPLGY